jgi:hypothetical protein
MAVTGNRKVEKQYVKTYGLAPFEVLGVNMSNQELKDAGFYVKDEDLEKEREFLKEREGIDSVMIEFACKTVGADPKYRRFSFFIEDKNDRNKEDSAKGDLYKFINDQGSTAWSKKPNTYVPLNPEYAHYFTGKDDAFNPRPAKVGEENFMNFMRNCMAIDYKNGGTISYDTKKFFKGNFKDLRSDLASDFLQTILVATTIRIKETDEGIKEIESFYPYLFAPGSYYKLVVNKKDKQFTQEDIDAIRLKEKNNKEKIGKKAWISPLEQIILKMSDADYGCKDVYHLGVLKEFVSGEHIETSDTAIVTDEDYGDTSKY